MPLASVEASVWPMRSAEQAAAEGGTVPVAVRSSRRGAMLWKVIGVAIFAARSMENADICLCMYVRKVSELHRPRSRMVSAGTLLRCRAMAPPARKEWLETSEG